MEGNNEKALTVNQLAEIIAKSFDSMEEKMERGFGDVKTSIKRLEEGQEDIKLSLAERAYKFDLDYLDNRVKILEKKSGLER